MRDRLTTAAVRMATAVRYDNLGTFEFLVDATAAGDDVSPLSKRNPRLQVEHTVTEEVTGIDLVKTQIELASGKTLDRVGLRQTEIPAPRGYAIQMRINMESMGADGSVKPAGGTLTRIRAAVGAGRARRFIRLRGIHDQPEFRFAARQADCPFAVGEFRRRGRASLSGACANCGSKAWRPISAFLQSLLRHPDLPRIEIHTRFVENSMAPN